MLGQGGDHLSPGLQERCVPPHIVEALNVWLAEQCESHISGRTSSHAFPSPFVDGAPDPPLHRSPFGHLVDSVPGGSAGAPANPASVSHSFIDTSVREVQTPASIQFTEGGPVRLTRFVEMPLDVYYARLNQMVSQGRFEHIGRASIRLEGATAWGVWLRVDHWSTALGNRPRLRCGALFHVANRTVSFHGAARDAVRFLLPIFESSTVASISQLSSVQRDEDQDPMVPPLEPAFQSQSRPPSHRPPSPTAPPPPEALNAGHHGELSSFRTMVRQLIDLCRANQGHLTCYREEVTSLRAQVSSLLARPAQAPVQTATNLSTSVEVLDPPPPRQVAAATPWRVDQVSAPLPHNQVCLRQGCHALVPSRCPVRFCQEHCTSPRCNAHAQQTRTQERSCRLRGCQTRVPRECVSGFCRDHCTSARCSVHREGRPGCISPGCISPPSGRRTSNVLSHICRVRSCSERVHPECSSNRCTLHCSSPHCPFHSCPNGMGAGSRRVADP